MADTTERDANGVYTGPSSKTITLRAPVERKGDNRGDLKEITIHEPTGKQLSQYFGRLSVTSDNGMEATMLLIALTSGVPTVDVERMKQRDLDECGAFLEVFTKVPPKKDSAS